MYLAGEKTNSPTLGESISFRDLMKQVESSNTNEYTFYCHTKGISKANDDNSSIAVWVELMYKYCLCNIDVMILSGKIFGGAIRSFNLFPKGNSPPWHFTGTFYWFNHLLFRNPNIYSLMLDDYYATEMFPGYIVKVENSICFLKDKAEPFYECFLDKNLDCIVDNLDILEEENTINKQNIFESDVLKQSEIFDDLEDALSIATEPIGETNDIMKSANNFNLDDINDIDDLENLESIDSINHESTNNESKNIKKINISSDENTLSNDTTDLNSELNTKDVKKINIDNEQKDNLDLNELLNGKTTSSSSIEDTNVRKIEIDNNELNNMSIKQLKDLAKTHKLKTSGTKQELINSLSKVL